MLGWQLGGYGVTVVRFPRVKTEGPPERPGNGRVEGEGRWVAASDLGEGEEDLWEKKI